MSLQKISQPQDVWIKIPRNTQCPCGSGKKYKSCCLEKDQQRWRTINEGVLPQDITISTGKLHLFIKYICQVFSLPQLFNNISDSRRSPDIPTFDVVNSLFFAAVLRMPSINALEGNLKEPDFQQLLGKTKEAGSKAFSADVIANTLDKLDISSVRNALENFNSSAERNKVFRGDAYGNLRCVAIDGWEPFSSYDRHCPYCLERKIEVKDKGGNLVEKTQYYHKYVIAFLVAPLTDIVIGIEPVRNKQARLEADEIAETAEGELTAALRLLDYLKITYGTFIDAFVFDGLYPNGPVLTKLESYNYSAFIVLRNKNNEPLKDALNLFKDQPPIKSITEGKEKIDFWKAEGLQTLDTFAGKIDVIQAKLTNGDSKRQWCIAVIGEKAKKLGLKATLKIMRSRWHIEDTCFHQFVCYWNLNHVFRHTANAILSILFIWAIAFNLIQFFVYKRLKRQRNPTDVTNTIRHIIEMMNRDLGSLIFPINWNAMLNSS